MGIIRTLSDIRARERDPKVNASLKGNQYLIFKDNLNSKKEYLINVKTNINLILSKIGQTIIGCQFRFDKKMMHHYRNESVMIALQTILVTIS